MGVGEAEWGRKEWEHMNSLATYPQPRAPTCTHVNLLVFIAQQEVLEQRLLLQRFQEHEVLHPHTAFQESHVPRG